MNELAYATMMSKHSVLELVLFVLVTWLSVSLVTMWLVCMFFKGSKK